MRASELPAEAHVLPDIPSPATCAISVYQDVIIPLSTERARRLMLSRKARGGEVPEVPAGSAVIPQNTNTLLLPFQGRKIWRKGRAGELPPPHHPNNGLHALQLSEV